MNQHAVHTSASRKDDHVRLATAQADARQQASDFDDVTFVHDALAAIDVARVSLETDLFGARWSMPLYINAMTGGSEATGIINASLARVAAQTGIAIASGSMSHLIKDPSSAHTFTVLREGNPDGFILANLSANATVDDALRVIEAIDADALQIHVNSAQEMVMPEGDRVFSHWAAHIQAIVEHAPVPVIIKEVGFGIGREALEKLADLGVQAVDVSGRGGTNFAAIENSRREHAEFAPLLDWGLSTVNCLIDVADTAAARGVTVLASGGVRTPLDVARALSLGASAVGVAGGFLHVLQRRGEQALIDEIERWQAQLTAIQVLTGAATPAQLCEANLLIRGAVREFAELRDIDVKQFAQRGTPTKEKSW